MKKTFQIIFILILLVTTLFSKEQNNIDNNGNKKLKIAVIDLKAMGVSETTGSILSETLRSELFNLKDFEVMNRQDMQALFEEKAFQQSGVCDDTECIVEMGLVLGVEKVVSGSIGKLGETYSITLKLVDVETAKNEVIVNKTKKCDEDYLFTLIKELADELANYDNKKKIIDNKELKEEPIVKEDEVKVKKNYDDKTKSMISSLNKKRNEKKKLDVMLNFGVPYSSLKLKWYFWKGLFISSSVGTGSREVSHSDKYDDFADDSYHALYLASDGSESTFIPSYDFSPFKFGFGYQIFSYWKIDFEVFAEVGTHDEQHEFTIDLIYNDEFLANCDYFGETSGTVVDVGFTIDRVFKYNIHLGLDVGYSFSDDINYDSREENYSAEITDEHRDLIDEAADDYKVNLSYKSALARLVLGWKF